MDEEKTAHREVLATTEIEKTGTEIAPNWDQFSQLELVVRYKSAFRSS